MYKHFALVLLLSFNISVFSQNQDTNASPTSDDQPLSLAQARTSFQTKVAVNSNDKSAAPIPPADLFQKITYPSAAGNLAAYLTPDPKDGRKHPAIIWITGGDCNSISDVWSEAPRSNEQTASAYRKAGIIMMFPSLRGGNDNPGAKECFYGEVDDVVSAFNFLRKQPYVDSTRIYLGGHSTGGTLALLTAEYSNVFRAVFSFGPVASVRSYSEDLFGCNFKELPRIETRLRSPIYWLSSIHSKTFVMEGKVQVSNYDSIIFMTKVRPQNPKLSFYYVPNASHFTILAPFNDLIAKKILSDTSAETNIQFSEDEINQVNSSVVNSE